MLETRLSELESRYNADVALLRRQLAEVSAGRSVAEEAILEGRAFSVIEGEDTTAFLASHPDVLVLDVRTDPEWEGGHIPNARHINVATLEDRVKELPSDKQQPIMCICAGGGRSAAACQILADRGYTRLWNVRGGMNAYTGSVVRG